MNLIFRYLYQVSLSLWVGGMACFAFFVTPNLFTHLERNQAIQIVTFLFPIYYPLLLGVTLVALLSFLLISKGGLGSKVTLSILVTAVLLNLYQLLFLFPETAGLVQQIGSFDAIAKTHPLHQAFIRLHIQANVLGLVVLLQGLALLFFASKKQ